MQIQGGSVFLDPKLFAGYGYIKTCPCSGPAVILLPREGSQLFINGCRSKKIINGIVRIQVLPFFLKR